MDTQALGSGMEIACNQMGSFFNSDAGTVNREIVT